MCSFTPCNFSCARQRDSNNKRGTGVSIVGGAAFRQHCHSILRQSAGYHHGCDRTVAKASMVVQRRRVGSTTAGTYVRTFLTPSVWLSILIKSVRESDGIASTSDQDLVRSTPISASSSPKSSGASSSSISDTTESGVSDLANAGGRDMVSTQDAQAMNG